MLDPYDQLQTLLTRRTVAVHALHSWQELQRRDAGLEIPVIVTLALDDLEAAIAEIAGRLSHPGLTIRLEALKAQVYDELNQCGTRDAPLIVLVRIREKLDVILAELAKETPNAR